MQGARFEDLFHPPDQALTQGNQRTVCAKVLNIRVIGPTPVSPGAQSRKEGGVDDRLPIFDRRTRFHRSQLRDSGSGQDKLSRQTGAAHRAGGAGGTSGHRRAHPGRCAQGGMAGTGPRREQAWCGQQHWRALRRAIAS